MSPPTSRSTQGPDVAFVAVSSLVMESVAMAVADSFDVRVVDPGEDPVSTCRSLAPLVVALAVDDDDLPDPTLVRELTGTGATVVVISGAEDDGYCSKALASGAYACVGRGASIGEVRKMLRTATRAARESAAETDRPLPRIMPGAGG